MAHGMPVTPRNARRASAGKLAGLLAGCCAALCLVAAVAVADAPEAVAVAGDLQEADVSAAIASVEDALFRQRADADTDALRQLPWRQANPALLRGGTSRSQWLLRVSLHNLDDQPRDRVLQVRNATLDRVHFAFTCSDGSSSRARAGDHYPAQERATADRHPAFPVTLPARALCDAWFTVNTGNAFRFPLWLLDTHSYQRALLGDYLTRGLVFGMQLLAVAVGLMLALQRRNTSASAYALAVASQALLLLVLSNLGYVLFWSPATQTLMSPAAVALCWVLTAHLCLTLLPAEAVHWSLRRLLQASLLLACAAALAQMLAPDPGRMALLIALCAVGLLLLLVMTGGAVLVGAAHAGLVTAAILSFTLGGLAEACGYLGLVPLGAHELLALQAGFLLSTLLLGIALWHRLADARQQRSAEREVDRRVAERTRALSSTVARLTSQNRRLDHLSSSDVLTGAFNRRYMDDCLQRHAADERSAPLSLILFDIDFFKQVNDRHGHPAGDHCLQQVAHCVQTQLRQGTDVLCRYGGEEFAVILPATDAAGASRVAEKIRLAVARRPLRCPSGQDLQVTISLGVSTLANAGRPGDLVAAADRALYEAKRQGRNRWRVAPA